MQVFKCALSLVFRNPLLLFIYAVGLGFMGILMGSSFTFGDEQGEYVPTDIEYAIIDRDSSQLSAGISDFLATKGAEVAIEDSRQSLQDCVAKGEASYVLVIPKGFEDDFVASVKDDGEPPQAEVVYSFYSTEGFVMDAALANYMRAVHTYIAAELSGTAADKLEESSSTSIGKTGEPDGQSIMPSGELDISAISADALQAVSEPVRTQIISRESAVSGSDQFCFYLQFDSYVIFAAIIACLGMLLTNMNKTDMRKRAMSSPVSYVSYTLQIALACLLVTAMVWAWLLVLGAAFFSESMACIPPFGLSLMAATTFAFALVALSVAFLVGQIGMNGTGANAIGNILGLVVSFFGGAWIPLSLTSAEVSTVAHFLPGFWYTDALSKAAHLSADASAAASIGTDIGILLLFAAAIFCIGLVVGKLRAQTSSAGGNAAAALPSEA